jgi:predicted phosphate transport protein (TIGR00153 family)
VAALRESPLSRFFGRAPAYGELYGLIRQAGENARRSTALLAQLLARWPDEDGERHDLVDCEHEGDRITHDIIHHLHKRSATPFDRADLLALASRIDDVVDYAEEVAAYLFLYKVEAPMEQAVALADVLEKAGAEMADALEHIEDVGSLRPHVVEIGRLEDEGDRIERECLAALFDGGVDPMLVIRWKDIVERLEEGVDSCDHVGHVLEGIVVKHA